LPVTYIWVLKTKNTKLKDPQGIFWRSFGHPKAKTPSLHRSQKTADY